MYRAALLRGGKHVTAGTHPLPQRWPATVERPLALGSLCQQRQDYSTLDRSFHNFPIIGLLQQRDTWFSHKCKHQLRFISKKRKKQLLQPKDDPFAVLGVARTESYSDVKRTFLQIAMKHHPDTTAAGTEGEREANKDVFVAARKAFEAIVAGPGGLAILKSESADHVEEDDLDQWFKNETGYDMPFMDAKTMKEVAEMTESVGGGLDRDGGMWTLARMVADTVKSGGDGRSLLQLDAGTIKGDQIDGILRRKRRRW
jgi:hypothetical protein